MFVSYAQNLEDVMLWRALGTIEAGTYIDVGAYDPLEDAVTKAFYDRGWSGINIEPVEEFHRRLVDERPRDINLRVALGKAPGKLTLYEIPGTGLSTSRQEIATRHAGQGYEVRMRVVPCTTLDDVLREHRPGEVHFLKIDVEGDERAVLEGTALDEVRPWIVLVEATEPNSPKQSHAEWEPLLLEKGYEFTYFDGLNRFYVAREHSELKPYFAAPPNYFDQYVSYPHWRAQQELEQCGQRIGALESKAAALQQQLEDKTGHAQALQQQLEDKAGHARALEDEVAWLRGELEVMTRSRSWRLTAPLRAVMGGIREVRSAIGGRRPAPLLRGAMKRALAPAIRMVMRSPRLKREGARLLATRPALKARLLRLAWPQSPNATGRSVSAQEQEHPAPSTPHPSPVVREQTRSSAQLRAVHQFHSGTAYGDAITNSMFLIRDLLRGFGFESEIYAEHIDSAVADRILPLTQLPCHSHYGLIIHHSMGFGAFDVVVKRGGRRILIYHNITPPDLLSDNPYMAENALFGYEQLDLYKDMVDVAIAVSEFNALELRKRGFKNICIYPLLYDIDALLERARQSTPVDDVEVYTVIFVGRIVKSKGQAELVDAFACFRRKFGAPCRLVLVGNRGDEANPYLHELRERVRMHRVDESVIITGLVPDDELHAWYAKADLYVSLSDHEGYGVPLIEAMAHRIPILAWPAGAVPYTVAEGAMLLRSKDAEVVAEEMLRIAQEPETRVDLLTAQRAVLERLHSGNSRERLLHVLGIAGITPPPTTETRRLLAANTQFLLAGHVNGSYSLASVNVSLALALNALFPGRIRVVPIEGQPTEHLGGVPASVRPTIEQLARHPFQPTGPTVLISHHYPVYVPDIDAMVKMAIFFWEETLVPRSIVETLNASFDGIIAPTRFVEKLLIDSGVHSPIRVVPLASATPVTGQGRIPEPVTSTRPFTFLHISSCFPRKGVDVLLRAYKNAFSRQDNVRLIVKGFPNPHNHVDREVSELFDGLPDAPLVEFINQDIDDAGVDALYKQADAVVLPTRGEGFNLPAAEALAHGIPLITTRFGGHLDFCNDDNAWLVDYDFAPSRSHLACRNSLWVEPDIDALARAMREVAHSATDQTGTANHRIARGKATAKENSSERWAAAVREFALDLLLAPTHWPITRAAWVSTWNIPCGIAEYSRFLLEAMPKDDLAITVLADHRTCSSGPDLPGVTVKRAWAPLLVDSVDRLAREIVDTSPDLAIIQHQWGILGDVRFAELLRHPLLKSTPRIATLHSTAHLSDLQESEREKVLEALKECDRVLVHTVADMNRLKRFGIDMNTTLFPHGAVSGTSTEVSSIGPVGDAPCIGSYGFFLRHKGIRELIEAASLLREEWPDLRVRLVNAEYPVAESSEEITACRQIAERVGLQEHIEWITEYLPNERSLELLKECDVIVLPYQHTGEASSAAVRMALASGRPTLTTPLPIFEDVQDATGQLPGGRPGEIRDGIRAYLRDAEALQRLQSEQRAWLEAHDWQNLAARLAGLMRGLVANRWL